MEEKINMEETNRNSIQIRSWEDKDINLFFQINELEMMEHLGGSETREQIMKRHKRYLELNDKGCIALYYL